MKLKAVQGLDFEQRKFLQALSKSSEHLATHGQQLEVDTAHALRPATSHGALNKAHNGGYEEEHHRDLQRSSSDLDISGKDIVREGPEYSISSNMKVAETKGTFGGLETWIGDKKVTHFDS